MPVNERYPITLILKDHGEDFDLAPWLEDMEYEETGNNEIANATIILNQHFGRFNNEGQVIGNHTFPKINFFDRIYFKFTDPDGNIIEDVVQVLKFKPDESGGTGNTLTLLTEHQGFHFFRMHNLKQYQRESGFEVVADNGNVYSSTDVRGINQPSMEKHNTDFDFSGSKPVGNAASKATYIDFDFASAEFFIGDGINIVAKRLGSSVESGGELEFFDWRTISKYNHNTKTDLDIIQMQFRISGDNGPNPKIILDKNTATIKKILDSHGELEPEKSTSVFAWGDMNMGSQPPGYQVYFGEKEFFFSALEWTDGRFYKAGMRVKFKGVFYTCVITNTGNFGTNDPLSGIGFFWSVDTFTPSTNYSNWTKDKPQYWANSGFGYIFATVHPQNDRACCYDHNLVIRDINHRRSWVDLNAGKLSDIPSSMYLLGGNQKMYRGFRILIDQNSNSIGTPFTQNGGRDRNDKLYVDSVVMHNGNNFTDSEEYKNWDVFLESKNDLEILSMRDGICFVYAPCDALSFNGDCTGSRLGGWKQGAYQAIQISSLTVTSFVPGLLPDCVHPYHINTVNDPEFKSTQGIEGGIPGQNSAVKIQYNFFDSDLSHGAWINLAWPLPRDGHGGAFSTTIVGEKFINPTLDLNNMHLSSLGKRGLNQGSDDEFRGALEYGKINATRVYLKLEASALGGLILPGGDFKYRIALFDTGDNVIVGDATITHNFNFSEIEIEITNFQIWRGRHGIPFTPLQEIEILDIFETRNVVRMAISSLDSYDGDGRYVPLNKYTKFTDGTTIHLDGFHFVKPLTAMSQLETTQGDKPSINFEREPLDRGQISNYSQLRNDVLSTLELEQFKRVEYEINRPLRCDIKFGDEFTYINPRVVNDTDFGDAESIDLVCKKNIYIYSKKRGKTVKTIGVKRFRT